MNTKKSAKNVTFTEHCHFSLITWHVLSSVHAPLVHPLDPEADTPPGRHPQDPEADTPWTQRQTPLPLWTEFLAHTCENITFPQLLQVSDKQTHAKLAQLDEYQTGMAEVPSSILTRGNFLLIFGTHIVKPLMPILPMSSSL